MSFSFVMSYLNAFAAGAALVAAVSMWAIPGSPRGLRWFLTVMIPVNVYFAAAKAIEVAQ